MTHKRHDAFMDALHRRKKLLVAFDSSEDGGTVVRTCAPMDYGPSRRAKDGADRYHLWDYDSDKRPHPIQLLPERIVRLDVLDDEFDPGEFVTWDLAKSPWWVVRNWGRLS